MRRALQEVHEVPSGVRERDEVPRRHTAGEADLPPQLGPDPGVPAAELGKGNEGRAAHGGEQAQGYFEKHERQLMCFGPARPPRGVSLNAPLEGTLAT